MGNSKRSSTIYKPKKGRRVTAKKLYKIPQRGGGFLETFLGGEPDLPESEKPTGEEKEEETGEEEKEEETGEDEKEEETGEEETGEEETGEDEKEEESSDPTEETIETEEDKGLFATAVESAKNTASELQSAFTKPIDEDTSADAEDMSISEMDQTPVAAENETQETLEGLRMKNTELLEKVNILHETIEKLQEEKIASLQGSTPLEQNSNEDEYGTTPINENPIDPFGTSEEAPDPMSIVTPEEDQMDVVTPDPMSIETPEGEQMEIGASLMDDSAQMDIVTPDPMSIETPGGEQMEIGASPMDDSAQMNIVTPEEQQMNIVTPEEQQMEMDLGAPPRPTEGEQLGGTKHRRNKHRRTKRKRKGSNK